MKSVGEVMAIGRTFQESLQKALRGLETVSTVWTKKLPILTPLKSNWATLVRSASGMWLMHFAAVWHSMQFISHTYDPWFLSQIEDLVKQEQALTGKTLGTLDLDALRKLKRSGFPICGWRNC